MSSKLEDLVFGIPTSRAHEGAGKKAGALYRAEIPGPMTALDKTTTAAWTILDDEAQVRADKTARLKAARQARDRKQST